MIYSETRARPMASFTGRCLGVKKRAPGAKVKGGGGGGV